VFSGSTGVQPTLSSKTFVSPPTRTSGGYASARSILKGGIKKTNLRQGEPPAQERSGSEGSLIQQMSGQAKSKRQAASDRLRISGVRRRFSKRKAAWEAEEEE
jgi:hypothetical protein